MSVLTTVVVIIIIIIIIIMQVAKLELVHSLTNLPNIQPIVHSEKCRLMNDEELYVHRDSVASYADINRELARYFSCSGTQNHSVPDSVLQQSSHCMRQLKWVILFFIVQKAK